MRKDKLWPKTWLTALDNSSIGLDSGSMPLAN